jgi:hypothetical protein
MSHALFLPHGSFSIRTQGQIIISDMHGPWNIETLESWGRSFAEVAQPLCVNGPIASVVVYFNSLLTSPDALALFRKMLPQGFKRYGMTAAALVYDETVEGYLLGPLIFNPIHEGVIVHQTFTSLEPALLWVAQCLEAA